MAVGGDIRGDNEGGRKLSDARWVRIGNYYYCYYYSRRGDATGHVSSSSSGEEYRKCPFNPVSTPREEWNGFCAIIRFDEFLL